MKTKDGYRRILRSLQPEKLKAALPIGAKMRRARNGRLYEYVIEGPMSVSKKLDKLVKEFDE